MGGGQHGVPVCAQGSLGGNPMGGEGGVLILKHTTGHIYNTCFSEPKDWKPEC